MNRHKGFTLIEIMIALMLGIIVIGGALSIYISTIRGSTDITNSARLNYDLDSVMQLMANDIRRAGYWGGAIAGSDASENPFMAGNANIQISNYTDADGVFHANGCILYTYDADNSDNLTIGPTLPTNLSSYYGFRFDRNSIWMRSSVTAAERTADTVGCGNGDWNQILNEQKVNITVLTFIDRNSQCLNTVSNTVYAGTGAPLDTSCPAAATAGFSTTGDLLVETRQIEITITGNVINDVPVTKTLIATVKVRNNRIFTQ